MENFKKIAKYIVYFIIIVIGLLLAFMIISGVYLNETLTSDISASAGYEKNIFNIRLAKFDNVGECPLPYYIYPWEDPDQNCSASQRNLQPFDFFFARGWKNSRALPALSGMSIGFEAIHNWFFKEKNIIICLDNFNEPLNVNEKIYLEENSMVFADIKGVSYTISQLSPEQKIKWKNYIDSSIKNRDFPQKATLAGATSCDKINPSNTIGQFDVRFSLSTQTREENKDFILNE